MSEKPPPNDEWNISEIIQEELRWLLKTLAVVAVTLGIGRMIKYLTKGGIDVNALLQENWQKQVDDAVNKRDKE